MHGFENAAVEKHVRVNWIQTQEIKMLSENKQTNPSCWKGE